MAKPIISKPVPFEDNYEVLTISDADFFKGMSILNKGGYQLIPLGEALAYKSSAYGADPDWFTHYVFEEALFRPDEAPRIITSACPLLEDLANISKHNETPISDELIDKCVSNSVSLPMKFLDTSGYCPTLSIPLDYLHNSNLADKLFGTYADKSLHTLERRGIHNFNIGILGSDHINEPTIRSIVLYDTSFDMKLDTVGQSFEKNLRSLRGIRQK